jgi:GlpG protein
MRFIGNLPSQLAATTFSDILRSLGIEHQVELDGEQWALWVRSDDDFEQARERFTTYLRKPTAPEFVARAREGAVKRRLADEDAEIGDAIDERPVFRRVFPNGVGALTAVLVGICVSIAGAVWAGYQERVFDELLITRITPDGREIRWNAALPEIFGQGEFWRLITPALVHFHVGHLVLSLIWLIDLGSAIEARQGTGSLGFLFVTIGIGSNLAQTWLLGPVFCGVSGILFGFMGYIWTKSKLDPASGLAMHPYTVVMMLVFFCLGLSGVFTMLFGVSMGNGAHASGLVLGIILGFLSSLPQLRRRGKAPK